MLKNIVERMRYNKTISMKKRVFKFWLITVIYSTFPHEIQIKNIEI